MDGCYGKGRLLQSLGGDFPPVIEGPQEPTLLASLSWVMGANPPVTVQVRDVGVQAALGAVDCGLGRGCSVGARMDGVDVNRMGNLELVQASRADEATQGSSAFSGLLPPNCRVDKGRVCDRTKQNAYAHHLVWSQRAAPQLAENYWRNTKNY